MATFSPFFKALFFADFAEKLQDVVDVEVEHAVLLEILQIIHSVNRNYGLTNHSLYPAEMLAKLYKASLKRMSFEDVQEFLKKKSDSLVLSPNDVAVIVEKCQDQGKTIIRCTTCQSTNCREQPGYNNPKYYRCNNCQRNFYAKQ